MSLPPRLNQVLVGAVKLCAIGLDASQYFPSPSSHPIPDPLTPSNLSRRIDSRRPGGSSSGGACAVHTYFWSGEKYELGTRNELSTDFEQRSDLYGTPPPPSAVYKPELLQRLLCLTCSLQCAFRDVMNAHTYLNSTHFRFSNCFLSTPQTTIFSLISIGVRCGRGTRGIHNPSFLHQRVK